MTLREHGWRLAGGGGVLALVGCVLLTSAGTPTVADEPKPADYATAVRPLLQTYCLGCHSAKAKKGGLDLERFATLDDIRKDLKPWQGMIEQIETGEMPPKDKPQPTADEMKRLTAWVRAFLDAEATARKDDPGHVPLRRLSNAEYDATVRDLTGVDLRPTREFPADAAAGEGFTNAAEALTDISPALFTKYLNAARDLADHAVLLPDGFRFSAAKTRRDWSDEGVAKLRAFYARFAPADGKLLVLPYLAATVKHRDALQQGKFDEVAAKEKLNAKYLGELWKALTDRTPSYPLDQIRTRWRTATEKDVPALAAEVAAWQAAVWQTARVGSYMRPVGAGYAESPSRQVPNSPVKGSPTTRLAVKPAPGQSEVTLHLAAHDLGPASADARVVWQRPRFEGGGKPPLLLADYADYGAGFAVDFPTLFADTPKYLAAVAEAANDPAAKPDEIATKHGLDAALLKRWADVLAVSKATGGEKAVPAVALDLLTEKAEKGGGKAWINGWRKKGTDLPSVLANSSDTTEHIPGRVVAHGVSVHPTPTEFVAAVWTSPVAGEVKVSGKVAHAHPACGNGVAWWVEHRRGDRATVLAEGAVELGKEAKVPVKTRTVEAGDRLILAVDAKNRDHVCDTTEIAFTVTETAKPNRGWSVADVADSIHDGNPHADKHGNKETWSFVKGPTRPVGGGVIPADSVLGRWRDAAGDPKRQAELPRLAEEVRKLLTGPRPAADKDPNRVAFDALVTTEGVLLKGVNWAKLGKPKSGATFGLPRERFDKDGNLVLEANAVVTVRLPAALFYGREFVAEGKLPEAGDRVVQFQATTAPPALRWDGRSPVVASALGSGYTELLAGLDAFRRVFPLFVCFPPVIPTDEAVSLKMFHREDDPLARLFLTDAEAKQLEHLWTEHNFVSKQARLEYDHLPQFIGFVTQDQPKAMELYFLSQKPAFQKRADELAKAEEAAAPKQLDALAAFASRAYRRPLKDGEKAELRALYQSIRKTGAAHDEAFRGALMRVFASPAFLFRIEEAPPGKEPKPVSDWELATRLSYFLWSSAPDDELRRLAAEKRLSDPKVLAAQTQRMLKDPRMRNLAVEFGTQWIHVRGFDALNEKSEKLFPTFDTTLRKAINEESVLFFHDLFEHDRPVSHLLDADATYLNETLAKHYGIPGVSGPHWRRVEGVKKYGRGGLLGLASVQAKESGASRTSPILRGNWVVETLLGEKLPKPPPNVPKLPEEEGADKLTIRQQVERHTSDPACATCHQRIDPFGFALEKYDTIGRLREKDLGGLAIDTRTKLKDGTAFDGLDGLRTYLLTKKKDVIVRLFCKRLLGYALGRSVTLSDTALLDDMVAELNKSDGKVSAAVLAIIRSPQFRMVRGAEQE